MVEVDNVGLWPHQVRALVDVEAAINAGQRRICLTSPTGGGKSKIASELIRGWAGKKTVLYTNRRMLTEQLGKVLDKEGHSYGVRASGYQDERHLDLQVSMIQTELARLKREGEYSKWTLHEAERVVVDEAHLNSGDGAKKILNAHHEAGAVILGLTATPLDIGEIYDHLIIAGTKKELRECGALVTCIHYGPDEPDLRHIGRVPLGQDLTEAQNRKAIMVPGIFGRVYEWSKKLNPDAKPTILFAPGVGESIWFCEEFAKKGVRFAHIDGSDCWLDGRLYKSSPNARAEIMELSKHGKIAGISNRFVLREGIDAPWLVHGILSTVFGSLQSYLQAGGRLLRACPGVQTVCLQDHGGNWWRHGSLNADRDWNLAENPRIAAGRREDRFREKKEKEPFRCPQCSQILRVKICPCGFEIKTKSRPVVQADGSLKQMTGDIFKPRVVRMKHDTLRMWESQYYRAKNSKNGMTFNQAEAMFFLDHGYYPPRDLKLMPTDPADWYAKVREVPKERLR